MSLWEHSDFTPMLLGELDQPFNSKDYLYELKFDGLRALIFVSPEKIIIKNRHNKDITYLFPELTVLRNYCLNKVIFDGEIIALDEGKPSFSELQKRFVLKDKKKIDLIAKECPVIFVAFDILYLKQDLINLPLIKRKKILDTFLDNEVFIKSKYLENEGINLFKEVKKMSLEGIVAKEKKGIYEPNNRSNTWLKIKNIKEDTFFIGGYIDNKGGKTISLILGKYQEANLYYVGKVTLGKNTSLYREVIKAKVFTKSPFKDYQEKAHYLKPNITCQVGYLEVTKKGHLRQPFLKN